MFDPKTLLSTAVAVVLALIIYDKWVKGKV